MKTAPHVLSRLLLHLHSKRLITTILLHKIFLDHDKSQDDRNLSDPRVLCYAVNGSYEIHSSAALEDVSLFVSAGVLLHEIGHIHLRAFKGDESEIDVDAWILKEIPEAGYYYADLLYHSRLAGKVVTAKNIQHVSYDFLATTGLVATKKGK